MTRLGTAWHVVKKIINHAEDDDGSTPVYDKYNYWSEKTHALEAWETELRLIIAGKSSVAVPRGQTHREGPRCQDSCRL